MVRQLHDRQSTMVLEHRTRYSSFSQLSEYFWVEIIPHSRQLTLIFLCRHRAHDTTLLRTLSVDPIFFAHLGAGHCTKFEKVSHKDFHADVKRTRVEGSCSLKTVVKAIVSCPSSSRIR